MVTVNLFHRRGHDLASADHRKNSGKSRGSVAAAGHSGLKKSILLVAAFAQFSSVLFSSAAMAQTASTVAATALPTGGVVKAGSANINTGGTAGNPSLTIKQTTNRAAIDWNTFNIGSSGSVNFVVPDAQSSTLNRVLDTNASQIFGSLSSNGQVFLLNPNGVVFGASASVNVGGLVATTHSLSNEDYMAGKTTFDRNGATGKIINEGTLKSSLGGYIALLAPEVRNSGVIVARAGTVALAAGDSIALNFDPNGTLTNVLATPSSVQALIDNKKIVAAPDGQVILSGANDSVSSTTIATGATLQIGNGGTSGSLAASTITDNGTLAFNRSDSMNLSTVISGTGGVSQTGTGTTTLSGNNTYSGTVGVTAGTLILTGSNSTTATATIANGATLQIGNGGTTGSLASTSIVDNGTLSVNRSDALTLAGAISGTGNVSQNGSGTTTLSGNNTYAGTIGVTSGTLILTGSNTTTATATIANGTTLQIGNGGTSGSLASTSIVDNGALTFNRTDTFTLATAVSGTGSVGQFGTGTTILSGNNTYSGTVDVNGGTLILAGSNSTTATATVDAGTTLQIGNGGTTGSLASTSIDNNGTMLLNRSNALALSSDIAGTGAVSHNGSGTTTLSGNNTYSGTLDVTAGTLILAGSNSTTAAVTIATGATLQIGNGGTSGSLASTAITDNGTLTFNRSDSIAYSTVISGTGGVSQTGTGTTTLSGNNTYSGTVGVTAGTLILTGDNITTATATIASGATLQIGDGGTTGSLASASIVDNGTLSFNRTDQFQIDAAISGSGNVAQNGAGNVILSNNNSYSGTVDVTAGTLILTGSNSTTATATIASGAALQLGMNGTSGSLASASIVDNGALTFNRTDTFTLATSISGTGSVGQFGTGTTILSGNNSFSGTIDVTGGTLILAGSNSTTATTTVDANTTLQIGNGGTTGSLASTSIDNNGTMLLNRSNALALSSDIAGTGAVSHNGSGTTTLSGNNTYSGTLDVTAGTLILAGSNSTTAAVTIATGATLQIGNGGTSG